MCEITISEMIMDLKRIFCVEWEGLNGRWERRNMVIILQFQNKISSKVLINGKFCPSFNDYQPQM